MQPEWLPEWLSWILEWMHQEQALVAGLLALAGATATVIVIRKQIGLQEEQWRIERDNKEKAARARLPIALSDIVDYCNDAYLLSRVAFFQFDNANTNYESLDLPTLPETSIETLAAFVEQSSNQAVSEAVQELLQDIQVVHTRVNNSLRNFRRGQSSGVNNREAYADRSADAELLRIRTERLFVYARHEREEPTAWENLENAETTFWFGRQRDDYNTRVWKSVSLVWPKQD